MRLGNRDFSAWRLFGFALTAITVVFAAGLVIEGSELAVGDAFLIWALMSVVLLASGMVVYVARRHWLATRVTRHSMEPEGHILLPPLAVIVIGALLAFSGWVSAARFALSRGAFEHAVRSGETFEFDSSERWIGLYKIHGIQIDALGRTAFNLGDCGMFAHCELEFDATTPCESRSGGSYRAMDTHWCVIAHYHF